MIELSNKDREVLDKSLENLEVQEVLRSGTDLREYAQQVDKDILEAEKRSVADYLQETENITSLHSQIEDCDEILERMENMLLSFQVSKNFVSMLVDPTYLTHHPTDPNRLRSAKRKSPVPPRSVYAHCLGPTRCSVEISSLKPSIRTRLFETLKSTLIALPISEHKANSHSHKITFIRASPKLAL